MRFYPQWRCLDEVFVKVNGELCYLWRAVDHEGKVLEEVATAATAGIARDHHHPTDDLRRAVEISEKIAHAPTLTQPGQPKNLL
jgi:hypothetical protein